MSDTTVYLIDDEPDLLELLESAVELAEMNPICFTLASEFFNQIPELDSRAIMVLDLHMPDMDGIEVMRRLATLEHSPALILMSGHDLGVLQSAENLGKAHNLRILASLKKPIVLKEFRLLLQEQAALLQQAEPRRQVVRPQVSAQELRLAIAENQLVLHYQPQIELATGKMAGVEALIRWQHPDKGMIFPDHFIALAEQSEQMEELTQWVIDTTVQQEQVWQREGHPLGVSVNISATNITTLTLPEQLSRLLATKELNPKLLTLEITESALMGELVTSLDILTRLRLKGFNLSIDDFGTGYSSFSQLHKVPFTELKIDQSFVFSLLEDKDARSIVETCIMMGHQLKMKVVAEGVETREHQLLLKEMGCDIAQGYWFSKPVPAEEISYQLKSL